MGETITPSSNILCDYCKNETAERATLGFDGAGDGIYIFSGEDGSCIESDSWEFEIYYCPICGRKLA